MAEDRRDLRPDAARKRLRECRDQKDACEAIREIVSNLLGCEEMALFQLDRNHWQFSMIWSFGIDQSAFHLAGMIRKSAFRDVINGEPYIDEEPVNEETVSRGSKVSAFVPIRFKGQTTGALALLRLLPQKAKVDELDRELLAVLSTEAGQPLFGGGANGDAIRGRKR